MSVILAVSYRQQEDNMSDTHKAERLIKAWVTLSGIIKNCRITKGLMYNEAIVMMILYNKFKETGVGIVSIKEITAATKMLKSLVNRTVNSLEKKGFLERCNDHNSPDKRMVYVKYVEDRFDTYLSVHNGSIEIAENIIKIIGSDDADALIRIADKVEKSGYTLN